MNTIERARGRWREILPQLGIDSRFLHNNDGPCPLCGGKDRFHFDDKDGSGSYFCKQCGVGVGIVLVRKKNGWDHDTACDEIDRLIGYQVRAVPARILDRGENSRSLAIRRELAAARDPDIVDGYLRRRGISARSPVLVGHPRCRYFDDDGKFVGHFPAVLAPFLLPDGMLVTAQRIYDAAINPSSKTILPVRGLRGGTVRLFEPDEELGIAKDIETALAANELFSVPVWAALSAKGIETFVPPPGLLRLHVFGDQDADFSGQIAANILARRLSRDALTVEVHMPPEVGIDWLAVLKAQGTEPAIGDGGNQ